MIRVLVADDEPLARRGVRQLLAPHSDITVVGESRNGLETLRLSGHVIAARSRGVSALRILSIHILLPCVPGILAVAEVAVAIAFGAAIPVEFATETPGLGQLAWQAATARDLPLICVLTMIVTTFVLSANGIVRFLEACFSFDRGLQR